MGFEGGWNDGVMVELGGNLGVGLVVKGFSVLFCINKQQFSNLFNSTDTILNNHMLN